MFGVNSCFGGFKSFLQSPGIQGMGALAERVADLALRGSIPILAGRAFLSAREGSFLSCMGFSICTLTIPSMRNIIKYGMGMYDAGMEIFRAGLQTRDLIGPSDELARVVPNEPLPIAAPSEEIIRDLSLGILTSARDIVVYGSSLVSITALGVDNVLGGNVAGEAIESFHVIRREGNEILLIMNQRVEGVFNASMDIVSERASPRSLSKGAAALKAFNLEVPKTLNKLSNIADRACSVKIMVVAFIMFVVIGQFLSSPGAWVLAVGKKALPAANVEEERRDIEGVD